VSLRFDFAELAATERYKLLGGLVVPPPIALVTSHSPDGRVNAARTPVRRRLRAHPRPLRDAPLTYEEWLEQSRDRGTA
jgi:hypothetical protein